MTQLFDPLPETIRPELASALETAWSQLAAPGPWLTGTQRLARCRVCGLLS
ncbi:MAG: hypothetical protein VYB45_06870 [Pseudomonadota bacterium]|nr:hypothetical protein [Pseudomonadota bacterium]